jgi:hypothetical protein
LPGDMEQLQDRLSRSRTMIKINRPESVGGLAAASVYTIVPPHVLESQGYGAPSDMIVFAQVGYGMQAQGQDNSGLPLT